MEKMGKYIKERNLLIYVDGSMHTFEFKLLIELIEIRLRDQCIR